MHCFSVFSSLFEVAGHSGLGGEVPHECLIPCGLSPSLYFLERKYQRTLYALRTQVLVLVRQLDRRCLSPGSPVPRASVQSAVLQVAAVRVPPPAHLEKSLPRNGLNARKRPPQIQTESKNHAVKP